MDINLLIAKRLRELRDAQGLSLAALAERCGVSRSNISLIERGESSPTATVLDKLSAALGVTVASLFERPTEASIPVLRSAEQPTWVDPGSGYVRRNLSPAVSSAIQLVEVSFPAGQRVAYETSVREVDVHQQVWIVEGTMEVTVGEVQWTLSQGDCLAMRLNQPTTFHNPTAKASRYLVALVTLDNRNHRRNG